MTRGGGMDVMIRNSSEQHLQELEVQRRRVRELAARCGLNELRARAESRK